MRKTTQALNRNVAVRLLFISVAILSAAALAGKLPAQSTGGYQPLQPPENCYVCHQRQFEENLQNVKAGYRNVSPTFNALELAGNFLVQNALENPAAAVRTNLRPIYSDTPYLFPGKPIPVDKRLNSASQGVEFDPGSTGQDQLRAGFCLGCHATARMIDGDAASQREVPAWNGVTDADGFIVADPDHPNRVAIDPSRSIRPLRDYHFVDAQGLQIVPEVPGTLPRGSPGTDFVPSLAGAGVTCDQCHTVQGPDLARSLERDGYANFSLLFNPTKFKTGPFPGPIAPPRNNFHFATSDTRRINYLRSGDFCNACHDVRPPAPEVVFPERDPNNPSQTHPLPHYRLENLSTEWHIGPYNSVNNPFGQVIRCQDCHMSLFPYAGNSTYPVPVYGQRLIHPEGSEDLADFNYSKIQAPGIGRREDLSSVNGIPINQVGIVDFGPFTEPTAGAPGRRGDRTTDLVVTTPTPGIFPSARAAVAPSGAPSPSTLPVPERKVVTHYFTGVDVPILTCAEMNARLRVPNTPAIPCVDDAGFDTHRLADGTVVSVPRSLEQRRVDLMRAAVRISLRETDREARFGSKFHARVTAAAFTGHRFPAGFSQERTTYIELRVVGRNGVVLYQSGYQVDKPHPEMGEMQPDGNLDDEDLEHVNAMMDARRYIPRSLLPAGAPCGGERVVNGVSLCLNPNFHDNQIFELGPDNGPEARVFFGEPKGLVLFRNELLRIYDPRPGAPASTAGTILRGNVLGRPHIEEVFSATRNNTVDNFRSLPPLEGRTFEYEIQLPTEEELRELKIDPKDLTPLRVTASVHFQHFPPLFLRFLGRVTGDRAAIRNSDPKMNDRAPVRESLNQYDERLIDSLLKNNRAIAIAEEVQVPVVK